MTPSEFFTNQFYSWEYRGRGWFLAEKPIHLEPPFVPFFRHGYQPEYIDDGKRPTLLQKAFPFFNTKAKPIEETIRLDYETLEPFAYEEDEPLTLLSIILPKERDISIEKSKELLVHISSAIFPLSFEILGTAYSISLSLVVRSIDQHTVRTYLTSFFPEITVIEKKEFLYAMLHEEAPTAVVDFGLREEFVRPLALHKKFDIDPLTSLYGLLDSLQNDERIFIQILFTRTVNPWAESMLQSVTDADGTSFFSDCKDSPKLTAEKLCTPLLAVTFRACTQAATQEESLLLLNSVSQTLITATRSPTNALQMLTDGMYSFEERVVDIYLRESRRLGMLISIHELVSLLHVPTETIASRKLLGSTRKTKEVPKIAQGKLFVLGLNHHNNKETRVTVSEEDRVKHTHIIGATGTGKSTLLQFMILQDIYSGNGIALIDPHGDLIDSILINIPDERIADVILIDPSDTEYAVGLNILKAYNDVEKEILSSDLVASFKKLSTSWGDQMNAVFGNVILAMLEHPAGGTLHDIRRFLIEKEFREQFLEAITDPSVLYYWRKEYPLLKTNSIGPILTRLDTFLRPRIIRNMMIQKTGLDFEGLMQAKKIILCKLSLGVIGVENSYLLGSLIVAKLHQAAFARQTKAVRNPFYIYIDEFQNFITPSLASMLSGVRKYNIGLILAHQDLQQLQKNDTELLSSVLSNTHTRIVFRVGEPDAKKLQDGFGSFDAADLQNQERGQAIMRIEQPQYDCTLETIQVPKILREEGDRRKEMVIAHSRKLYARDRAEVEAILNIPFAKDDGGKATKKDETKSKEQEHQEIVKETRKKEHDEESVSILDDEEPPKRKNTTEHRYLQTLIKKMAESYGYTATLEVPTPDMSGSVDILLTKEGKRVALEICVTTDSSWEMHNIQKCVAGDYDEIISVCTDKKRLEAIKKVCNTGIADFVKKPVAFFTPDELFDYLKPQESEPQTTETHTILKGYRVNVSYGDISKTEMDMKRKTVAGVVMKSLRKQKKKE